jgi:hypothetical protein
MASYFFGYEGFLQNFLMTFFIATNWKALNFLIRNKEWGWTGWTAQIATAWHYLSKLLLLHRKIMTGWTAVCLYAVCVKQLSKSDNWLKTWAVVKIFVCDS